MEIKQLWLDTTVYQEEDYLESYLEDCGEELENFIKRYEKRYHTSVNNILLISERESFYGDWNPASGRVGYRLIQNLDQVITSNDVKIYVGEDNFIHVDLFDHDGADYSVVKLIPGSIHEMVNNDVGCYACELDYVEMLQKRGQLKPTKFWQAR